MPITITTNPLTVHISWTIPTVPGQVGVVVERSLDRGQTWQPLSLLPVSARSYDDFAVTTSSDYTYRVTEIYGLAPSNSVEILTPALTVTPLPPTQPRVLP